MRTALDAGHPVPAVPGPTIADALRSPVAGAIGLEVCSRLVEDVVLVSDDEIREGMRFLYERAKLACEPGAAVGVAALLAGRLDVAGIEGRGARHLGRERLAPAGRRDPRRLTAMERLHPEVAKLGGGDRRSIGRSNEVVADVLADPTLFDLIFDAIASDDPLIAMRAADAVEKVTARRPELLRPHKRRLLTELASIPQQEVRWHVAQMLPRLSLSARERRQAAEIVESYLDDRSGIVRTCAMQALAELAVDDAELRARVVPLLRRLTRDGTPAMRARGRRLLAELDPDGQRRSVARRRPNAMSTHPVTRSTAALTRGRRSASPTRLTKTAQPHSQATPMRLKTAPSRRSCPSTGPPGDTNCGRKLVKKTAIFGFRRLLRIPWRNGERRLAGAAGATGIPRRHEYQTPERRARRGRPRRRA